MIFLNFSSSAYRIQDSSRWLGSRVCIAPCTRILEEPATPYGKFEYNLQDQEFHTLQTRKGIKEDFELIAIAFFDRLNLAVISTQPYFPFFSWNLCYRSIVRMETMLYQF
jgi:hypothetical protein